MRERITISIQNDLLKRIDRKIDGTQIRNRSHAIEHFINESLGLADIENVVILGGGKGALKLVPIIDQSIKDLVEFGVSELYLAVGYLGDKIKEFIGDGTKYGIKINYIAGGEGTAGALAPLKNQFKKTFLVVNLDDQLNLDIKKLTQFHRQHLSAATIATNNILDPKGFYLFEPEIFNYIPAGFSMLETDIFPKLAENNQLINYPIISHPDKN